MLSKSITIQRKIFKIESKDIRNFTKVKYREENKIRKIQGKKSIQFKNYIWRYEIDKKNEKEGERIISISESDTLRILDELLGRNKNIKVNYDKYRKYIRLLKNGKEIKGIYKNKSVDFFYDKLNEMQFQENYVIIQFNRKKDFRYVNKGLLINGRKFKRLYGTSGSLKNNKVIYICDEKINPKDKETLYKRLLKRLENGANKDIELVPSKYESYLSLSSSASTPVDFEIKPEEILVTEDHITKFRTRVTEIRKCNGDEPNIVNLKENEYEMELEQSDGCGIIVPSLAQKFTNIMEDMKNGKNADYISSGFVVRHSFVKGSLFTFDFQDFRRKYAKSNFVKDIWGNSIDTRKVKIVMPASMFKLWMCYDSIQHYCKCCKENGRTFSITKMIPRELESERTTNYQFLAPLDLEHEDVMNLIQPTINEFHDILGDDYRKSILYTKGKSAMTSEINKEDADFLKALMIEKKIINDNHVRKHIHNMIKKSIDRAKVGKIKIKGNYAMISGSIFAFAQHVFSLKAEGLLKKEEFYSGYWNREGVTEVAAMRAPMCTHQNYRILRFKRNKELDYWYKYMQNCIVFNCWDSTAESLSGADKDGDSLMTTDNEYIIKGIKELPPIICPSSKPKKVKITEARLRKSNLNGFNNNVGAVTNVATSIRNKMASFQKGSAEWNELRKREMAIQRIQQSVIDSIKLGFSEKIPETWYKKKTNVIINENYIKKLKEKGIKILPKLDNKEQIERKKFNMKILADKKPYFFIYLYPNLMKSVKRYNQMWNINCIRFYGKRLKDIIDKKNKTYEEKEVEKLYYHNYPVDLSDSLMNKICNKFEYEFDYYFHKKKNKTNFDYTIMRTNKEYDKKEYNKIKELHKEYQLRVRNYIIKDSDNEEERNTKKENRILFLEEIKQKATKICTNEEKLCNIVLDMCYGSNLNPQFAWDICGERIIKNLLDKNNNEIAYFEKDKNGIIKFGGERFTMKKKKVGDNICQY